MSKKIFLFLQLALLTITFSNANADFADELLFKSALSVEFQAPKIHAKQLNSGFDTGPFEQQLKGFNNIALGLNFRIHKHIGINLNWSQFSLENSQANGFDLSEKSDLSIENVNFSTLFYFPIIGDDQLDAFIEVGGSDINYKYRFKDGASSTEFMFKDHETVYMYGAGLEFAPYDMDTSFRLSAQRYLTKLAPVNGDLVTFRLGMIKYF